MTSLAGVFLNADNFVGGDLTAWNLSRVMDLQGVFKECEMFNGDVSLWDVSRVVRFDLAFEFATSFAGDVSKWNTGAALSTRQMFKDTWSFSGNLSSWNTSNVVDMFEMVGCDHRSFAVAIQLFSFSHPPKSFRCYQMHSWLSLVSQCKIFQW